MIRIPKNVFYIINKLNKNHFDAYLVGGCVRDTLLNKRPKDYDICTNALPEQIQEVFKNDKLLLFGLKHGTVTVVKGRSCYEITTYRIDGQYSDGRHPDSVSFTGNLKEDLKRRDFTINAMAYDVYKRKIIDPFDGVKHLKNKVISCVGNAEERFNEDALRIMRALRFSSVLGFKIAPETRAAIFKLYKNLENVSWERINAELTKLLQGKNAIPVLREYAEVIFFLIPELKPCDGFNQNNKYHLHNVWEHTLRVVENTPADDIVLRLTALFHDIGKPDTYVVGEDGQGHFYGHPAKSVEITKNVLERLRYSNEIKNAVLTLIDEHSITFNVTKKFIRHALSRIGEDALRKLLVFRRADIIGQRGKEEAVDRLKKIDDIEQLLSEVLEEEKCMKMTDLAVGGKKLMEMGIEPGEKMGRLLKSAFEAVLNGDISNTEEELIKFIQEVNQ